MPTYTWRAMHGGHEILVEYSYVIWTGSGFVKLYIDAELADGVNWEGPWANMTSKTLRSHF